MLDLYLERHIRSHDRYLTWDTPTTLHGIYVMGGHTLNITWHIPNQWTHLPYYDILLMGGHTYNITWHIPNGGTHPQCYMAYT